VTERNDERGDPAQKIQREKPLLVECFGFDPFCEK
jgi:hypothetical protein